MDPPGASTGERPFCKNKLPEGREELADEPSGCSLAVGKPTLHSKQTAQNHLAYFFSCLGDSEIVSTRGSRDSEGEFKKKKNPSVWTCLANKALENCLPELGTCCSRNYHPPSGYAWLKSLILLPESCSHPQKACKGNDCLESDWAWDSLLCSICKLGKATLRSTLMVVRNRT